MKTLQQWLYEYSLDHQNEFNQKMHLVCVPLIFLSVVALLRLIPLEFSGLRIGDFFLAMALFWYMTLKLKATLIMLLQLALAISISIFVEFSFPQQALIIFLGIFVLAWVGQFWGHKKEGRKPSFFKDLQYLLIGPLWVWLGHQSKKS